MERTLEQLLATEDPAVVAKAQELASDALLDIHLGQLREALNLTQTDLAQALGVKQPTVSDMEQPGGDIHLSSLKRYVEASGGKLRLDIELPNGSHYWIQV